MYQFPEKMSNFDFLGLNLPKYGFWCQNFKTLSLDLKSASLRYYVYQFSDKIDSFEYLPENGFCHRNFKNLIMDTESTPPLYHVCQFSIKMDNIWFFDLDLGKLPNYMQYFGSNIDEGVAESWVEVDGGGCTV